MTSEARRRNMQAIRSSNTKIEILLGKQLWAKGYRYRKNNKKVFGKPDFTLKKYRLAIFCDSEFWHGKDWDTLQQRLNVNRGFWINKISRNIERDKKVNQKLTEEGWTVLRFWETDIKKNIQVVLEEIQVYINSVQQAP
jgi:DNA mismatch endonuclease Vsr